MFAPLINGFKSSKLEFFKVNFELSPLTPALVNTFTLAALVYLIITLLTSSYLPATSVIFLFAETEIVHLLVDTSQSPPVGFIFNVPGIERSTPKV